MPDSTIEEFRRRVTELRERGAEVRFEHHREVDLALVGKVSRPVQAKGGMTKCAITWPGGEVTEGVASCRPDENFDRRLGRLVSFGRAVKKHGGRPAAGSTDRFTFVLREVDRNAVHARVTVFAGPYQRQMGNCGQLTFRVEEWEALRRVLGAGGDKDIILVSAQTPATLYSELAEPGSGRERLLEEIGPGPGRDH